ncbi:hypothetical protein ACFOSW_28060 [Paenibacillus sp. GCM10012303]|jgi:hypothetical protein
MTVFNTFLSFFTVEVIGLRNSRIVRQAATGFQSACLMLLAEVLLPLSVVRGRKSANSGTMSSVIFSSIVYFTVQIGNNGNQTSANA